MGVWVSRVAGRAAHTTRSASRRTSPGSTAYVAVGSVSGSAIVSGALPGSVCRARPRPLPIGNQSAVRGTQGADPCRVEAGRASVGGMRVALTGGAGFVGAAVAGRLCADGHDVLVLDSVRADVHADRGAAAR